MRTTLTAIGASAILALAACGGDDDGEAEAEFRSQVNGICASYGPKLALLPPPAEAADEWAAIAADLGDLLEASVNELRLLESPEGLSKDYADWLELRSEMATAMRDVQVAGGTHDDSEIDAGLARVDEAMAEADSLAEEIGFPDCSPTGIRTA